MSRVLLRKIGQLARDPVLRRYLISKALGRIQPPAPFVPHRPPYLKHLPALEIPTEPWPRAADGGLPQQPLILDLPGEQVVLTPDDPGAVFKRSFADLETEEAVYRFAWVALTDAPCTWVWALWRAWGERSSVHPDHVAYTAAERACNMLDVFRRFGVPHPVSDNLALLAAHGPEILAKLEYQGEAATHNHLANNGRALYRLGVELGLPMTAQAGLEILENEAVRLFLKSGVLREGSSHYHLLYLRNYADCWLTADRHHRPEASRLKTLVVRLMAVLPHLRLPGGLPLIGDISPDSPPEFLAGLLPEGAQTGWVARLDPADRQKILALRDSIVPVHAEVLRQDGWVRLDGGEWSLLAPVSPQGWPFYPGHAHQDMGSFELHWHDVPVIVDPGRGAYGETGEAAFFRSAAAHNGIVVDDQDPYPANKPYYDDAFRQAVAGPAPRIEAGPDWLSIGFDGFIRVGAGSVDRHIRLAIARVLIKDRIDGSGQHEVIRRFHTPLPAAIVAEDVIIDGRFRLSAPDARVMIAPVKLWNAYGRHTLGTAIEIRHSTPLPWTGTVTIEVM